MDSAFTAIHRNVVLLDLVDEAWAADCLSDDGTMLSALESRASSSACLIGTQNSFPLQRRKTCWSPAICSAPLLLRKAHRL